MSDRELTYEESLDRLIRVVEQLEQGDLGLEESMKLFQEGMELAARCEQKLKAVEEQVRVLVEGSLTEGDTP